jgi:hypothetical protein
MVMVKSQRTRNARPLGLRWMVWLVVGELQCLVNSVEEVDS